MPLSIRLTPELEARIDAHSRETGLSKSRIIASGVQEYLDVNTGPSLYDLAMEVLGEAAKATKRGTAKKNNHSETRREEYRTYIKKKHAGRTGARG